MNPYISLIIAALLPAIATAIFCVLDYKSRFQHWNGKLKQLVFGLAFGGLAILGTEWGIPVDGAQVNCRDAAVVVAGLLFGAPAGIIAGILGGVERWFAVAWGVGTFTRVACTVSTILAGFYAAGLRRFLFDNKRPGWMIAFAAGIVIEVFHLTMVFVTNMASPNEAMAVVKACSIPMIISNGASVLLSAAVMTLFARHYELDHSNGKRLPNIPQTIQKWLLITVAFAFVASSFFVFALQNQMAIAQEDSLLTMALDETEADIRDASNNNMLILARRVKDEIYDRSINLIAKDRQLSEINIINNAGTIVESTDERFIGYDMASGAQSAEFLCLLGDEESFVQDYGAISYDASLSRKYAGVKMPGGFVQVGYDAQQFQRDIFNDIIGITKNRHVGQTGYILIIDEQYNIVSAPEELELTTLRDEVGQTILPGENITFTAPLNGENCCFRYRSAEGYHIISVLPEEEVLQSRDMALYVNAFLEILIFAVMFGLIYLLIKRIVVNEIHSVNLSLANITNGNLDEVVDVNSSEEFSMLSADINQTVGTLKQYIAEASARIDKELELAKSIQLSALPNVFPAFPKRKEFDIYASTVPAKEVGGDFYDFYMTGKDDLHFLIADVSGKGIPAAMFMMRAKTELKTLTESGKSIDEVFTEGNEALCDGNDAGMFVTAWQGGIDLKTGLVRFANAGHNPPLVRHAGGEFEYFKSRAGLVLAGMEGMLYKPQELQLQPGDTIFLYTDGVTEATNADVELYGEDRLKDALNSREFGSMQELCAFVKSEVDAFVGDAPQFDDITMLALKYEGAKVTPSIHFEQAKLEDITEATAFLEQELEKLDCPMKTTIQFNIALDELFSNIVRYGYPDSPGPITVAVVEKENPRRICLKFTDEGIPYNPLKKEDPDVTLSAEERQIGGLGIFMVKKSMDDMKYRYENGQNVLTIIKKI